MKNEKARLDEFSVRVGSIEDFCICMVMNLSACVAGYLPPF
jgi:hypothetical protein